MLEAGGATPKWGKLIDQGLCIGCHACTVACKAEHQVPLGVTRTFVEYVEVGIFPDTKRHFQVTRCNQCDSPPCVASCPVTAMFRRPDGIVDFDRDACIGCKACIAACPYDAIYINPDGGSAEKCNFCTHRLDLGMEPACVVVCPTQALVVGNLNDPESDLVQRLSQGLPSVRRPEKETNPKVFYMGASPATLDPTSQVRRKGMATAELRSADLDPNRRARSMSNTAAASLLAYGVPAKAPWDWRVSAYTWTKAVAAGLPGVLCAASIGGVDYTWQWKLWAGVVGIVFLLLTTGFLVADLTHPTRFYYILIRPQWRSWLARGAFILISFGGLIGLATLAALAEGGALFDALRWPIVVLAIPTAGYTAFILRQSKGRDLWQGNLLPLAFLVEATAAGAAALAVLGPLLDGQAAVTGVLLAGAVVAAGIFLADILTAHQTGNATIGVSALVRGRYAVHFWGSLALLGAGAVSSLFALAGSGEEVCALAGLCVLAGLFLHTHAFIQAGQVAPQS